MDVFLHGLEIYEGLQMNRCFALSRRQLDELVHFLDIQIAKKHRVAKPNGIETKIEHLVYRIVSRPILDDHAISSDDITGAVSALGAVNKHRPILRVLKNSQNQNDLRVLRVPSVRRNAQIFKLRADQLRQIIIAIAQADDGLYAHRL